MRGLALAVVLFALLPTAQAEGTLRARIKARIEERRADKGSGALHELQVQDRKVLVHLPAGYDAAKPAPLVLAFHGGGGHAEYMADDGKYGLQKKADEAGFVVAFPNGYSKLPGGKFATWNAGGCCGDARDRKVDDVAFARAVVKALQARYNIDAARVFATGMSNGGMLSHRLACEAADVFRAVASVAGTDATASCTPSRPIPVLHIHARDDDHVLFDGGAGAGAFRDEGKVMSFISVPETVSRWVQRDHCTAAPQRTLDKAGAYCEVHTGCSGGVAVQLCVTETGGHSWPGAQNVRRGKEAASQALDANDAIWRFFEQTAR
ncbi:poly(3-hydroxybutyrate) depolymerase [Pelomonas sp. Root1217]|uniref:extracellular catalytic domain type 1 short-chain-length polyhydroxyalkanoate depolymerase n=1 Tax=Pelomonas sp. Root1217 TaxID=1736430 RepID=UPI00070E3E52|nr:PHB depolymerase family esterase [Pelomonas sp. Root1217]KQV50320.1 poly(3-hydroxybutyrate) depolymerase [Pelomonas sp. Root1217]